MLKKAVKQKDGSALLIAIVIMMVVTMLSLLLLLAGYSFFATSLNQQSEVQCREMAENISLELEQEITAPHFDSFKDEQQALESDTYPLWSYLRINLWQEDNWPYYNGKEVNHDEAAAYRYFDVSGLTENGTNVLDDAEVLLYWTNTATADRTTSLDQLYVQVTCRKGKEESTVTTVYDIQIASDKEYALESSTDETKDDGTVETVKTYYSKSSPRSKSNPKNLEINPEERWTFTKAERF